MCVRGTLRELDEKKTKTNVHLLFEGFQIEFSISKVYGG